MVWLLVVCDTLQDMLYDTCRIRYDIGYVIRYLWYAIRYRICYTILVVYDKRVNCFLSVATNHSTLPTHLHTQYNFAILSPMQSIIPILPYVQIVLSVLLISAVLLQRSSAGLGGAFGDSSNFSSFFHARRGAERILFIGTVTLGVLFAITAIATLLLQ